jgi:hypothetical protein
MCVLVPFPFPSAVVHWISFGVLSKGICPMHKVSAWCKSIVVESRRNENKNFNLMRRKLLLPSPFSHAEMA